MNGPVRSPIQPYHLRQALGVQGIVTLTIYAVEGREAEAIDRELQAAKDIPPKGYFHLLRLLADTGGYRRHKVVKNLVVTSGRAVLARLLAGDETYSGAINYGALGTGSTAPAAGNTALVAEAVRKQYATRSQSGTTVSLDFYFAKADGSGTYQEFGTFIDGASSANSGQLFNRVLTGGWPKTALEAMTVSQQIDINSS